MYPCATAESMELQGKRKDTGGFTGDAESRRGLWRDTGGEEEGVEGLNEEAVFKGSAKREAERVCRKPH